MDQALTPQSSTTVTVSNGDTIEQYIASLDVKPTSKDTYKKALKQFMAFI